MAKKKSDAGRRQALGILLLALVLAALFAMVAIVPPKTVQTGAIIGEAPSPEQNVSTKPMTVLRVIYDRR